MNSDAVRFPQLDRVSHPQLVDLEIVAHGESLSASLEVPEADVCVVAEIDILIVAVELSRFVVKAVDEFDPVVGKDVEEGAHVLDVSSDVVRLHL